MAGNMLYKCFAILYLARISSCANILALVAAASYSHQIAYSSLWKDLSLRGHNVTVLTTNPMNNPKLTNLTELDMKWALTVGKNATFFFENRISIWNYHQTISKTMYEVCDSTLSSTIGQNLLHNGNKFDLVLAEYLCPELLAFADIYDCPKVLIASMNVPSIYHNSIGELSHPVLHPEFLTSFHGELNFKERILSVLTTWYIYYVHAYLIFPKREKLIQQYFNSTTTIQELISDIDMMFLSVHPLILGPKAIGPATILVGGGRPDLSEPMSLEIKKFLDSATQGCVYVSLGTNVKSSQISQRVVKSIRDALKEIPYKVLWKYEKETKDIPNNVKIAKWLPQQKVLNHPNVKLFLCQGGLQSIEEAIYGEVPFVVIPFFADQYQNARILENKGIAVVLDRKNLNKNDLKNAIIHVITDSIYTERVKQLKKLILDVPMTGIEKAIWWTEYIIRNKGAKHLRNPAADLPYYQYYLIDVIGFLVGITILLSTIALYIFKNTCRWIKNIYNIKNKVQ